MAAHPTEHVASLGKGLAVLAHLAAAAKPQTLSDVAAALDLPRATARRFLLTLAELGYADTDGRHFRTSARVLELGYGYFAANPLTAHINTELERIVEATDHTSLSSVYANGEIVLIGRRSGRFVETSRLIGTRLPACSTSMGRVFLSGFDDDRVAEILRDHPPQALTQKTTVDLDAIAREIRKVRTQGYALVEDETTLGLRAIAAPVHRNDGRIVAAIDVVMIASTENKKEAVAKYVPVLKESAARLSEIANHVSGRHDLAPSAANDSRPR